MRLLSLFFLGEAGFLNNKRVFNKTCGISHKKLSFRPVTPIHATVSFLDSEETELKVAYNVCQFLSVKNRFAEMLSLGEPKVATCVRTQSVPTALKSVYKQAEIIDVSKRILIEVQNLFFVTVHILRRPLRFKKMPLRRTHLQSETDT